MWSMMLLPFSLYVIKLKNKLINRKKVMPRDKKTQTQNLLFQTLI
jgi:hypothetical protein